MTQSSSNSNDDITMATQHHTSTTTADVIVDVAVGDAVIPIHEHRQVDVNAVPKRE